MSIKLKLDGFDELLKKIEKAAGNVDKVVTDCMKESAEIMQSELKTQMQYSDVPKDLIDDMPPPTIENDYGRIIARVGYEKGEYNPKNPSAAYKVIFLNYGTPYRQKHGIVKARGFIDRAKKKAKPKIKKQQENALQESLRGLQH